MEQSAEERENAFQSRDMIEASLNAMLNDPDPERRMIASAMKVFVLGAHDWIEAQKEEGNGPRVVGPVLLEALAKSTISIMGMIPMPPGASYVKMLEISVNLYEALFNAEINKSMNARRMIDQIAEADADMLVDIASSLRADLESGEMAERIHRTGSPLGRNGEDPFEQAWKVVRERMEREKEEEEEKN